VVEVHVVGNRHLTRLGRRNREQDLRPGPFMTLVEVLLSHLREILQS